MNTTKKILALTLAFAAAAFIYAQETTSDSSASSSAENIVSNPADFNALNVPELDDVTIPATSAKKESQFGCGVQFGTGLSCSIVLKPYLTQEIMFRMNFTDVVGMDIGVHVMDNVLVRGMELEPWVYTAAVADFYAAGWYLGAGLLVPVDFVNDFNPSFIVRTGYDFGNWQLGAGKLNLRAGISVSPMIATIETEGGDSTQAFGDAIGSILKTIFNFPKLDVGVTYYLGK